MRVIRVMNDIEVSQARSRALYGSTCSFQLLVGIEDPLEVGADAISTSGPVTSWAIRRSSKTTGSRRPNGEFCFKAASTPSGA